MSKRFFLSLLVASSLLVTACGGGSSSSSSTVGPRLKNSALPQPCPEEEEAATTEEIVVEEGEVLEDVNCVEAGDEAELTSTTIGEAPQDTVAGVVPTIVENPTAPGSGSEALSKSITPGSPTDPKRGVFKQQQEMSSVKRTPSGKTTKLSIVQSKEATVVPNDLCKILAVDCASLNFVNVTITGADSFTASADIPNTAFAFPGMQISNTKLIVTANRSAATFSVQADASLVMFGSTLPMTLTGQFSTEDVSISLTLSNKKLGLNDVFGIPGLSITSISTQVKIIGVVPTCCLFSLTGTLPTFLKELGINPQSEIRVTSSMGSYPSIVGISVGSQDAGAPDIFNIKNVLSAKYVAASLSALPAEIDGVKYPQGLAMAFDGAIAKTPVSVAGTLVNPIEWSLDFKIGAFNIAGFQLEETVGSISKSKTDLGLMINGGIKGYGLEARLKGSFDVMGGLVLEGESSFKPAPGIDLGAIKLKMGAKFTRDGIPTGEFTGELVTPNYGFIKGSGKVGFKAYEKGIAYLIDVKGQLGIPGMPGFADVTGGLKITNCDNLKCSQPTVLPAAFLVGSASFYKQPRQSFSIGVNPAGWSFREEFRFDFDKELKTSGSGFEIGMGVKGKGSVVISEKGVSLGNGNLGAKAWLKTPDTPAVYSERTRIRLYRTKCSGPWYRVKCKQEGYWAYAGGDLIFPAIRGININIGAEVGIDNGRFYVATGRNQWAGAQKLHFS
jgi:hypothetical protein